MKIQKRFIVKVLSALCTAGSIATTVQPIISASSPKNLIAGQTDNDNQNASGNESNQNINQTAQNNQNTNEIINNSQNINQTAQNDQNANEIINNSQNIDPIKMYTTVAAINENIIDENSQDPKNIDRNERRKRINYELLDKMMGIHEADESDQPVTFVGSALPELFRSDGIGFCQIIDEHVKDEFDRFMYFSTVDLRHFFDISSYLSENEIEICENNEAVNFNFLSTKAKISKMLLDQEKDLIKKFLLKIECGEIFEAFLYNPTNLLKRFKNPYHCKQIIETFYYNALKEYYKNDNIEYDINANNLKTKKEAYAAALSDAENKTESDLHQKDEIFKKTYYETYALANAEIDAKAYRGRQNKVIKEANMQQTYKKIYDNQYNEVVKQIGIRDGEAINSRIIFQKDPIAQKNYDEGYLKIVRKKSRENVLFTKFDHIKYDWNEAQKAYFQYFTEGLEERGFIEFSESSPRFVPNDPAFKDFLKSDCENDQELINFKENSPKRYIEGCLKGLRERGRKFANADEPNKKKYAFEEIKLKQSDLGEFYNDFKKAYEQGLEEGLKEVELQKAKK